MPSTSPKVGLPPDRDRGGVALARRGRARRSPRRRRGAGTTRPGVQRRFAVGTPSARPRAKPRTTVPSSHGSRPSRRAACMTSPWRTSSRIHDDETRSPSARQRATRTVDAEAERLAERAAACRRRPPRHGRSGSSRPRRRARRPPRRPAPAPRSASGESSESSCVKRDHEQLVDALLGDQLGAPLDAREPARGLHRGAASRAASARTSRPCCVAPSCLRAAPAASWIRRWCPRCTPSNVPSAITRGPPPRARRVPAGSSCARPPRRAGAARRRAARRRARAARRTRQRSRPVLAARRRSRGRAAARRARPGSARAPAGAPGRRCTGMRQAPPRGPPRPRPSEPARSMRSVPDRRAAAAPSQ